MAKNIKPYENYIWQKISKSLQALCEKLVLSSLSRSDVLDFFGYLAKPLKFSIS